jgi:PDZ domain-containing protein
LTTTGEILQGGLPWPPAAPGRRSRLLVWALLGALLLVVAGVAIWAVVGASGYYVLSPGQAPVVTASADCKPVGGGSFVLPGGTPCVQLVVPSSAAHPLSGSIMMVDVYEGKATPLQFLAHELPLVRRLVGSDEFVPASEVTSGSASQLQCQNTEEAEQATSAAPVAALRQLGYRVTESSIGVQIDTVLPGTPAAAAGVRCGDVITAVDSVPTDDVAALTTALQSYRVGQVVTLTLQRTTASGGAGVLRLPVRLAGTPALDDQPAQPHRPYLGIVIEDRTRYNLPFPISAEVGSIGGPSDGLALALGFVDTLSQGRLTGGMKVAATGAITATGQVQAIGGAAQKAIAVRRAGAQVFLVPSANYAAAKSQAGGMKVLAVNTLGQAISDLESLGGVAPVAPAAG